MPASAARETEFANFGIDSGEYWTIFQNVLYSEFYEWIIWLKFELDWNELVDSSFTVLNNPPGSQF